MKKISLLGWSMFFMWACAHADSYKETYKWKDATGQIHYSDVPPTNGSYGTLSGKKPAGATAPASVTENAPVVSDQSPNAPLPVAKPTDDENPTIRKAKEADEKRKLAAQKAKAKEEDDKNKRENCESAVANLDNMKSGDGVYKTDANGERVVLDKDAVAKELEKTQKFIEKNCK